MKVINTQQHTYISMWSNIRSIQWLHLLSWATLIKSDHWGAEDGCGLGRVWQIWKVNQYQNTEKYTLFNSDHDEISLQYCQMENNVVIQHYIYIFRIVFLYNFTPQLNTSIEFMIGCKLLDKRGTQQPESSVIFLIFVWQFV